jgi:hypothetical protein
VLSVVCREDPLSSVNITAVQLRPGPDRRRGSDHADLLTLVGAFRQAMRYLHTVGRPDQPAQP